MKSFRGIKIKDGIVAKPIRASVAIQRKYHAKLDSLIKEMCTAAKYEIESVFEKNEPAIVNDSAPKFVKKFKISAKRKLFNVGIAFDKDPVGDILSVLKRLRERYGKLFDGKKTAAWFAEKNLEAVDRQIKQNFKEFADLSVRLNMTDSLKNRLKASIAENVSLIKSIPEKYFTELETVVLQAVQRGQDLEYLTDEIEHRFHVVRDRAAFIARDQTNKVTSVIDNQRKLDLGITRSVWIHSGAGKHPRVEHELADGEEYDNNRGLKIDGEYIFPGQLPNCRCTSAPVIDLPE